MIEKIIKPVKINKSNFAPYGDLISTENISPIDINAGYAKRFDNLADLDTSKDNGKTIISIFSSLNRTFPMKNDMYLGEVVYMVVRLISPFLRCII